MKRCARHTKATLFRHGKNLKKKGTKSDILMYTWSKFIKYMMYVQSNKNTKMRVAYQTRDAEEYTHE